MPDKTPVPSADEAMVLPRIMIVDDTPDNLLLLKNMLGDRGFDIFALPSGPLALRAAARVAPDLVLLDITMPEMDGYEVCRQFKEDAKLRDIPIIFLSALNSTQDKVQGFRSGAVDFITKPFQFEEVHARVTTHLKIRSLQQRLAYQNQHLQELVDDKVQQLAHAHAESRQRLAEIAHMNRNTTASVYSAAIAHDLRQPLAAILANAQAAELLLEEDPPDLQEIKEILADIQRDDQRANQIIQRMRSLLSKGEAQMLACDLNDIARDVVQFLSSEAKVRQVTLLCALADTALPIMGDRTHLQQAMINIVLNGMDAMITLPAAQRVMTIATQATVHLGVQHGAQLMVTDSGVGFGDHVKQAFESFFTTKPTGMGMGLSITASLIQAHGGEIRAANIATGGATVYFEIPLRARSLA